MPTLTYIGFRCARCKTGIRAPAAAVGRVGPCPKCRGLLRIPDAESRGLRPPDSSGASPPSGAPGSCVSATLQSIDYGPAGSDDDSRDPPASRDPRDSIVGTLMGGDFEIQDLVGVGAYARVYRARQISLNRVVAMKVISGPDVSLRRLARLQVEALALAKLSHPHILKVHCSGIENGRGWIATEFALGGSVAGRLPAGVPWPTAYRWFKQSLHGLEAVHLSDVVHRDLKPANLMLAADDSIRIADFGLTKMGGDQVSLTGAGRKVGTPAYLAPEQLLGEEVDGRADLYSLGTTFYHVFSGKLPFSADNNQEAMMLRLRENPAPLCKLAPQVPAEIGDAVAGLMHRSRRRRVSAATLLEWLGRCEQQGRLPAV